MAIRDFDATQYRTIRILKCESGIVVIPRCGEIQWRTNEQIEWVACPPELKFTVRFDKNESPFEEKEFNNENNVSGPLKAGFTLDKDDKYFAYTLDTGNKKIDPGIIIWK